MARQDKFSQGMESLERLRVKHKIYIKLLIVCLSKKPHHIKNQNYLITNTAIYPTSHELYYKLIAFDTPDILYNFACVILQFIHHIEK